MTKRNPKETEYHFKFIVLPPLPPKAICYDTHSMLVEVSKQLGITVDVALELIPTKDMIPKEYFEIHKVIIAKSPPNVMAVRISQTGHYQDIGRYFNPAMVVAIIDKTSTRRRNQAVRHRTHGSSAYHAILAEINARKSGLIGT